MGLWQGVGILHRGSHKVLSGPRELHLKIAGIDGLADGLWRRRPVYTPASRQRTATCSCTTGSLCRKSTRETADF